MQAPSTSEALDRNVLRDRARAPARTTFRTVVHRRRWCCAGQPEPAPRSTACSCRRGSPGSPWASARYRLVVPAWHSSWNSAWKLSRAAEAPATTSCVGAAAVSAWLRAKAPEDDHHGGADGRADLEILHLSTPEFVSKFRRRRQPRSCDGRRRPASRGRSAASTRRRAAARRAERDRGERAIGVQDHVEALVGARDARGAVPDRVAGLSTYRCAAVPRSVAVFGPAPAQSPMISPGAAPA